MMRLSSLKLRPRMVVALAAMVGAIYALSVAWLTAAETKKDANQTKPEKKEAAKTEKKAAKSKLTGADLYAIHCNRCHPERYPTEFSASQWKTIMLEMRVRANLPASEAKAILKYLQEESPAP